MQRYTVYLYPETALHVSGDKSIGYHGRVGTAVTTLLRKRQVAVTVSHIPDAVDTVVCAPDDGWTYHPKHVE